MWQGYDEEVYINGDWGQNSDDEEVQVHDVDDEVQVRVGAGDNIGSKNIDGEVQVRRDDKKRNLVIIMLTILEVTVTSLLQITLFMTKLSSRTC